MVGKDKLIGCGCLSVVALVLMICSFLVGTYYGKDIVAGIHAWSVRLFQDVKDKAEDVGKDIKEFSDEAVDSIKDGVNKAPDEKVKKEVKESAKEQVDKYVY